MKMNLNALLVGLLGTLHFGVFRAPAHLEVSASVSVTAQTDFYEPLAPHGAWIEVGSYGRCWRPSHVAVEWRPYSYGHWVWTDCGWYWASDEPWAWACYHYGSWVYDPVHSWIWVPGIEWAPAWVSWRVGGGYCGWAPLAPRGVVVAPALFVFVDLHRFHEPVRPRTVIVNNTTIINKTTVVGNMRQETRAIAGAAPRRVMINEGPGLEPVQQATGRKVSQVSIAEAAKQAPVPATVARKADESPRKETAPATPGQPKITPNQPNAEPLQPDKPKAPLDSKPVPNVPQKGVPPDGPPAKDEIVPDPGTPQPQPPPTPPGKAKKPPKGKGPQNKGPENDKF
jgi:hypothetical protein